MLHFLQIHNFVIDVIFMLHHFHIKPNKTYSTPKIFISAPVIRDIVRAEIIHLSPCEAIFDGPFRSQAATNRIPKTIARELGKLYAQFYKSG